MEEYVTNHFAPMQDRMSEGVAKTILELAPKLLENPKNLDFRATAMQTSAMALNTLLQTGTSSCWGTHRSSMILTAKYNMDHAASLVTILPVLWRQYFDVKKYKLAQMADRVWGFKGYGTVDDKANFSIKKTEEYAKLLKFPLHISGYVNERNQNAAVREMADYTWNMMGQKPFGENGLIKGKDELRELYEKAF